MRLDLIQMSELKSVTPSCRLLHKTRYYGNGAIRACFGLLIIQKTTLFIEYLLFVMYTRMRFLKNKSLQTFREEAYWLGRILMFIFYSKADFIIASDYY